MSFFSGVVFSKSLNMDTNLGAILPQDSRSWESRSSEEGKKDKKPATLILLHGLTDNWAAWAYRTRLLSYAEKRCTAVIMPEVQRSFYQNMVNGEAYFTYISEELPSLAAELFNVSVVPEDLMIAGLSMGGYGALRCGLSHPDRYRAVGAFSSAVDLKVFEGNIPERVETYGFDRVLRGIFGEKISIPPEADLYWLAEKACGVGTDLPFMMTCGTEDELCPDNEALYNDMMQRGFNVTLETWPGIHEWGFWDRSIEMFLERFA